MNNLMLMPCDALLTEAQNLQKENKDLKERISKLEAALAKPEQEPVYLRDDVLDNLYNDPKAIQQAVLKANGLVK